MDRARERRKPRANVGRVRLDLAAQARDHLAGLTALVVDHDLGGLLDCGALDPHDRRRHDRLVDLGRAAFGTGHQSAFAQLFVSRAVGEPALELMSLGAAERVFDHRSAHKQPIQFARRLEIVEIVASANVLFADEDLRHGRAPASLGRHRHLRDAVAVDADLFERHALLLQQGLGGVAVWTCRFCVDDDRPHDEKLPSANFMALPHYMVSHVPVTTRAKTSTSTRFAPARRRTLAAALTVAPDVSTSSINTTFRPRTCAPSATRKAPWTFSARCARLKPTWLGVALTLRSAPTSHGLPVSRDTSRASIAA